MHKGTNDRLVRVGVFYDGGYFSKVSTYYKYFDERGARLNLFGLHALIRSLAAGHERVEVPAVRIVEAHYFRGRFCADTAKREGKLECDRRFDDVLMKAGITAHYLPMDETKPVPRERDVDLAFALEALDVAWHGGIDLIALIACDGAYVHLVRKLHALGVRTLLLAWELVYEELNGGGMVRREIRPSHALKAECTYPVAMGEEIAAREAKGDPLVRDLFVRCPNTHAAAR